MYSVDNLLETAQKMADKKIEQQKKKITEKVNQELDDVKTAVEMVKSGLCYKVEDDGWCRRYVYATEEMLIKDYLSEPKNGYCRRGVSFEDYDPKSPWRCIFTVNGYHYYDMRYILEKYEKDVIEERNRITRYNDSLTTMINEFDRLVREHRAIKRMLDDWTARQAEQEVKKSDG